MSYTLEAILDQAIDNYPVTATLSPEVVAVLLYALSQIENPASWLVPEIYPLDQITLTDADEIDELVSAANMSIISPEVGFIKPYITTNPPSNTLPCDGGTYSRLDYPLLYAVIDAVFIVDADTFRTPNLSGLVLIGAGTNGARTFVLGDTGGEYDHTLDVSEIPPHSHTIPLTATTLAVEPGEVTVLTPIPILTSNTGDTGGNGSHNNVQPFGVVKYCVQAG